MKDTLNGYIYSGFNIPPYCFDEIFEINFQSILGRKERVEPFVEYIYLLKISNHLPNY